MVLIGIGANLPGPGGSTPLDTVRWAALQLSTWPQLQVVGLSRWYSTEPVPPSGQPPYVNGVALLTAAAPAREPDPAEVLAWLQSIEATGGRVRGERNAARSLDLDIIAMGEEGALVRRVPDPILPHPRAHLRAFVLVPLRDVAPGWRHPLLHLGVPEMIAALPPQAISVLAEPAI